MEKVFFLLTAFGMIFGIAGCAFAEKFSEKLDWTFDGAGISTIVAQAENGPIAVSGSDQGKVTIFAWKEVRASTKAAAQEFARQVKVHAEQEGNEIKIYKEYPKPPRGINVSIRYEIQSPSKVNVNLRTSNGAIGIKGVDGTIDAETSNGAIGLQGGADRIHVHTSNGKIEAAVSLLQKEGIFSTSNGAIDVKIRKGVAPISATTSNGSIDMTLPADFSGQLNAETVNGSVSSDFPIRATKSSKNRLVGQINQGGEANVKLHTSNGSIHLRKLR